MPLFSSAMAARRLLLRNEGDADFLNLKTERVFTDHNPPTHEQGTDRPGRTFSSMGVGRSERQSDRLASARGAPLCRGSRCNAGADRARPRHRGLDRCRAAARACRAAQGVPSRGEKAESSPKSTRISPNTRSIRSRSTSLRELFLSRGAGRRPRYRSRSSIFARSGAGGSLSNKPTLPDRMRSPSAPSARRS